VKSGTAKQPNSLWYAADGKVIFKDMNGDKLKFFKFYYWNKRLRMQNQTRGREAGGLK